MQLDKSRQSRIIIRYFFFVIFSGLFVLLSACSIPGENEKYFGKTVPPPTDIVRYVSGPEPESLDPQIGTSQVEQRIYLALFEGLVEYDPQTLEPIPAIAERWELNHDSTEFTFYLRRNARWSNNEPITAKDFVYTMRRGLDPKFASRAAGQAYYIKNGVRPKILGLVWKSIIRGNVILTSAKLTQQ